jgi:hypothetical protein
MEVGFIWNPLATNRDEAHHAVDTAAVTRARGKQQAGYASTGKPQATAGKQL